MKMSVLPVECGQGDRLMQWCANADWSFSPGGRHTFVNHNDNCNHNNQDSDFAGRRILADGS